MADTTPEMEAYMDVLDGQLKRAYTLASSARKRGFDPEPKVAIPIAKNMAERVEGLVSVAAPQIIGTGISKRIAELEKKYGVLDWRVSLIIAEEIAQEKFCKFKDRLEAMEVGIRVGFAYHTLGTVASPLEGLTQIKLRKTRQGKEYFAVYFSGPIRSAGGTGASVSVLIADYIRQRFGYAAYDPEEREIERSVTELYDYHERVTNLQYLPSEEEIRFLVRNLPIQIDGDPSEKFDVSNYKDLDRIETNIIRNGICLVIGEGLAQKAPKVWKQLSIWGKEFGLEHWSFLKEFVELQQQIKAKKQVGQAQQKHAVTDILPDYTYIKDLVAGRPVLAHPMRPGGFRLRYGRSRATGYSSCAIHPATMVVLNSYVAVGTQLKLERPEKATSLNVCDSIEGPIVLLQDGSVMQLHSYSEAKAVVQKLKEIIYLGDILVNYGDFFNRAHKLIPPGYCVEWWIQELEKAIVDHFGTIDVEKLSELTDIPVTSIQAIMKNSWSSFPSAREALQLSTSLAIPLHPAYTYFWKLLPPGEVKTLLELIAKGQAIEEQGILKKLILPVRELPEGKIMLEKAGIPHTLVNTEFIVIDENHALAMLASLNIDSRTLAIDEALGDLEKSNSSDGLQYVTLRSPVKIRDRAGVFIGARMGRPEKAKMRQLTGSPHVLFPVGEQGGRMRSFQAALATGKVDAEFPSRFCPKCQKTAIFDVCESCGKRTQQRMACPYCGILTQEKCEKHGIGVPYVTQSFDIASFFAKTLEHLKITLYPDLIKGVRGTSNKNHIPEQLAKGVLRAKYDVYVNKDGTTRYDMTQLPITHFKPKEIKTSIERLKELGYLRDIEDKPLESEDQVLEIKPQDVILPACRESLDEGADLALLKVAKFVDDLLEHFYGQERYYHAKDAHDLVGHLVVALAPHTSAGILCRIIGFSDVQGFYAHPLIHAATRRDCDGDEASVSLLMDMLLNFSREYLPAHRGSTQDACLVITSRVVPAEVDDMIFDVDRAWNYPLEFYNACLEFKAPWEVKIPQVRHVVGTEQQYEGYGFTHPTDSINGGVLCSAYKTVPNMEDKLKGQIDLAEKIRAVDKDDVARMVIEKHFLKDIKGNLRKFSGQQFRCVNCNEKFRRPPLLGKCTHCGGKIIFTISEGSVVKYLAPSLEIVHKFQVTPYLRQTLEILDRQVQSVFGRDKERQEGLAQWFA
ncbi:DNA polymerase II large subunit [Candidatus Woesearchaeota archaeon]|nr:DNA polymerase II large subunit [Candidatus Woesearchaeota archaeon]